MEYQTKTTQRMTRYDRDVDAARHLLEQRVAHMRQIFLLHLKEILATSDDIAYTSDCL